MKKLFAPITGLLMAAMLALSLTACGQKEEAPRVKTADEQRAEALANADKNAKLQDLLEQQRSTALNNANKNAAAYFAANPRFDASWRKMPHTDDQITPACPQGSGWAWVNIMRVEGKDVEKKNIWCSTSSESLGCYIEADFKKGPHAAQADKCNADLPHPLKAFR
jgi:predicted small lipoprotein YifL